MSKRYDFEKWTLIKFTSREICWRGKENNGSYLCKDNISYKDFNKDGCKGCFDKERGDQ